jgi:hypothetical protein
VNGSTTTFRTKLKQGICILWLLALSLSELYSAAATAFDDSPRYPAWESKLGWVLFVLPLELIVALVFLVNGSKARAGFWCVVANVLIYAGFFGFELVLIPESWDEVALRIAGGWVLFFVLAIGAAHLLRRQASTA